MHRFGVNQDAVQDRHAASQLFFQTRRLAMSLVDGGVFRKETVQRRRENPAQAAQADIVAAILADLSGADLADLFEQFRLRLALSNFLVVQAADLLDVDPN